MLPRYPWAFEGERPTRLKSEGSGAQRPWAGGWDRPTLDGYLGMPNVYLSLGSNLNRCQHLLRLVETAVHAHLRERSHSF